MQVGFSVIAQHHAIQFETSGPCRSDRPSQVAFFRTAKDAAILMGQLYYRDHLAASLTADISEDLARNCAANDAALVLAVYRQLGLNGLERLEGDFALVLWDAHQKRLVACRDPMGGYPLFWMQREGTIALSTSVRPLLDRLPQRSLDLEYLAEFLMSPGPVNERASERTAYEGIHRVSAGSILSVETACGSIRQQVYWHWLDHVVDPGTDHLEAIGPQYAHLLREAVRQRIRGRTACHLSGGMDSTAIALIARDWVTAGVGEAPLHTISLIYERLGGLARETPYVEAALCNQTGMIAHRILGDDLLDFDSFADPPPHDEPYVGLWRLGMDRATIAAAARCGASTVLTGLGADELLDMQPFYLTDLLRRGHLRTAWKEACKWAQVDNCSPWNILVPFGLANLFPGWTHGGLRRAVLPRSRGSWKSHSDWAISPWVLPSFARRYALANRAVENAHRTYGVCPSTVLSFILSSIESRTGDVVRWSLAAPRGMAVAHPFLDPRVICFSLGVQARLRPEPGRLKPVLAEAMAGILPERIRNRRRKGHFNEVYYLGLARNQRRLEAMIRQAPIEDLGMLDKDILIQCLQEAALGGAGVRPLHRFNLTLSLVKWLSLQDEWCRRPRPPTELIDVVRWDASPSNGCLPAYEACIDRETLAEV